MRKKSHPSFNVPNAGGKGGKKRVKERWRKPKGIDNKKRIRKKSAGAVPKIGYKNSKKIRGLHPSKKKEVLVYNVNDLSIIDNPNDYIVRIASSVGKRKRIEISKAAKQIGVEVINFKG